jgi:hypothetical protein
MTTVAASLVSTLTVSSAWAEPTAVASDSKASSAQAPGALAVVLPAPAPQLAGGDDARDGNPPAAAPEKDKVAVEAPKDAPPAPGLFAMASATLATTNYWRGLQTDKPNQPALQTLAGAVTPQGFSLFLWNSNTLVDRSTNGAGDILVATLAGTYDVSWGKLKGGYAQSVLYSQPATLAFGEVIIGAYGSQDKFWVSPTFQMNIGTGGAAGNTVLSPYIYAETHIKRQFNAGRFGTTEVDTSMGFQSKGGTPSTALGRAPDSSLVDARATVSHTYPFRSGAFVGAGATYSHVFNVAPERTDLVWGTGTLGYNF